eukprot:GHUV01041165.1.p1 GENE.GHUV01041165.1~~GHUV01041165.1.p1  ORF type:complete len:104 (+),score=16.65 GHUV01041165.1:543-854(+)
MHIVSFAELYAVWHVASHVTDAPVDGISCFLPHFMPLLSCSRNALLSLESRQKALCLNQALKWAQASVEQHEVTSAEQIAAEVRHRIASCGAKVDYVEVRQGL